MSVRGSNDAERLPTLDEFLADFDARDRRGASAAGDGDEDLVEAVRAARERVRPLAELARAGDRVPTGADGLVMRGCAR